MPDRSRFFLSNSVQNLCPILNKDYTLKMNNVSLNQLYYIQYVPLGAIGYSVF